MLSLIETDPNQAIRQLMAAHGGLVYKVLLRKGLKPEDIQDVMQDVWVIFSKKWHTFDPSRGTLTSWLSTVTSNKALDYIRRNARYQAAIDAAGAHQMRTEQQRPTTADTTLEDQDTHRLITHVLTRIPESQQRALELHYYQGLTHSEIADHMGTPISTTKQRLRLGMVKLRSMLAAA